MNSADGTSFAVGAPARYLAAGRAGSCRVPETSDKLEALENLGRLERLVHMMSATPEDLRRQHKALGEVGCEMLDLVFKHSDHPVPILQFLANITWTVLNTFDYEKDKCAEVMDVFSKAVLKCYDITGKRSES